MSEMLEKVARAIAKAAGHEQSWREWQGEAAAAIEELAPEIAAAYVRGVEWCEENPLDREYRFKAAADYCDKLVFGILSPDTETQETSK